MTLEMIKTPGNGFDFKVNLENVDKKNDILFV